MTAPSTDVIRRVFDEDGAHFLEVGPWPDDVEFIELRTSNCDESKGYWGEVNVTMTRAMAAELGRALIAASEDRP